MFRRPLTTLIAIAALGGCAMSDVPIGDESGSTPEITQPQADGAFLRVAAPDGTDELEVRGGEIVAEIRVGQVEALRTLGFRVDVSGADIVSWERDDSFLTSTGGQIVQLIGNARDGSFELVVATTETVSTDDEQIIARLRLRPTAGPVDVQIDVEGDHYGLVTGVRNRVAVQTHAASLR